MGFCRLGHATGVGLLCTGVDQGVRKYIFFKHSHVAYQIDGDDKHNRMHAPVGLNGAGGELKTCDDPPSRSTVFPGLK